MAEYDFGGFSLAWATYWGRRELGIVIDNAAAHRIAAEPRALRIFFDRWQEAVNAYPAESAIRLMGTPALTPDIIGPREPVKEADVPRPARLGSFATGTSTGLPQSEASGEYALPFDPDSEGARAGRTLRRGSWATPLGILALLTSWWLPLVSLLAAVAALAVAIPVSRLFFVKRVPWRLRVRSLVPPVLACAAIVLAVVALVPQFTQYGSPSKGVSAMSDSRGSETVARVLGRLRAHWPAVQADFVLSPDLPDHLQAVRVKVSPHMYLEATHTGPQWTVHPLTDASGRLVPLEPDHPYTIGVDATAPPEDFADRFYEEIYFWWMKLHPGETPATAPPPVET